MRKLHRSRGQALFETAIALPLFLLGLFGIMWAIRESSLVEQVQLGVRYGGLFSAMTNPYASFSVYSIYAMVDSNNSASAVAQTCAPGYAPAVAAGHASFWQAKSAPLPTFAVCPSTLNIIQTAGTETYSQPILLRNDYATLQAAVPVDGYLSTRAFGGANVTTVQAAQNFFRSPDVGTLLTCTTLGTAVKGSLEGQSDASTPGQSAGLPYPTVAPSPVVISTTASCTPQTFAAPVAPY